VLAFSEGMSSTPVVVSDDLVAELRKHFDERQVVELTAAIAWENWLARFNHALGIEAHGFSEGAFCPIPER
jgi:alkylhydroperoxidase family enzyme